jgi:adenylate kinase
LPIPALAEIVCEWEVGQKPQLKKKLGHEQQSLLARQAAATIASQHKAECLETHASRRNVCLEIEAVPQGRSSAPENVATIRTIRPSLIKS